MWRINESFGAITTSDRALPALGATKKVVSSSDREVETSLG
jgi:hypothetical protein